MDLDELRAVQASERNTDSLQSLRDSFYRDVAEYVNGLREERARAAERADDPFGSEEVRHLTDEIETAQEVAEAIYDRRLGKVVKRASLAAAGMPTDEEGLTDEEAALFDEVVERIESRRDAVLSAFAGEGEIDPDAGAIGADGSDGDAGGADPVGSTGSDPASAGADDGRTDPDPVPGDAVTGRDPASGEFDASEAMGGSATPGGPPDAPDRGGADHAGDSGRDEADRGGDSDRDGVDHDDRERADPEGATPDGGRLAADRTTVRITRDVGEIMGVDERVYDLADEDVVTLPSANAEPLLDRDAASRIE